MARLVARHEREDLSHHGVDGLQPAAQLLVEQEAGELGGAGALQELDENLARRPADAVRSLAERVVAHKVLLVVVPAELGQHGVHLLLVQRAAPLATEELLHLLKVRRVEPRRQRVLLGSHLDAVAHLGDASLAVNLLSAGGGRSQHQGTGGAARRARRSARRAARAARPQRHRRRGASHTRGAHSERHQNSRSESKCGRSGHVTRAAGARAPHWRPRRVRRPAPHARAVPLASEGAVSGDTGAPRRACGTTRAPGALLCGCACAIGRCACEERAGAAAKREAPHALRSVTRRELTQATARRASSIGGYNSAARCAKPHCRRSHSHRGR